MPPRSRILTISHSSIVLQTCETAKREGKAFSVICPESRPLCEGVTLARALSRLRLPVTVCADALAPTLVSECDLVLVGGDALAPEGLVNKIGTYPLALASREAQVPFIVLISSQKFLSHFDGHWIPKSDPRELRSEPMGNVSVMNRYFDITPLKFISQAVTEDGVYPHKEIEAMICK